VASCNPIGGGGTLELFISSSRLEVINGKKKRELITTYVVFGVRFLLTNVTFFFNFFDESDAIISAVFYVCRYRARVHFLSLTRACSRVRRRIITIIIITRRYPYCCFIYSRGKVSGTRLLCLYIYLFVCS